MKKIYQISFLILAAALIITGCSDKSVLPDQPATSLAKVVQTDFTATEIPVGLIDPGTMKIVGQNLIAKDMVMQSTFESENQYIAGSLILTLNGKLNLYTGEGPMHGTMKLTPDAFPEDTWEGNWAGYRTMTGEGEWTLDVHLVGHGSGDELERMMFFADELIYSTDLYGGGDYTGDVTGYIQSN
jgi:hypothetical protein